MNKQEMVAATVAMIESQSGYAYNKQIIIDTIDADSIPNGTVLFDDTENRLVVESNAIINYLNGKPVKTTDMVGPARDQALMMYAANQSRLAVKTGA